MKKIAAGFTMCLLLTGFLTAQTIKMNEIYSNGKSSTHPDLDWIELYNTSTVQVDVSGFKIYDTAGNTDAAKKMVLPNGAVIPAKGFYVITTDIDKTLNGFGLSNNGEKVWLEDKSGAVIDTITFPALTEKQTYSRIPDGGNWKIVTGLTKGITNGTGSSVKSKNEIIAEYKLQQNYPNPFNPLTKIEYSIAKSGVVILKVYNVLGGEVAALVNQFQNAGSYEASFNAGRLPSGIYFYKLQSGNFVQINKMVLIK